MSPRALAAGIGLILALGLASAHPAAACSMVFPPADEVLSGADLVFEGVVIDSDGSSFAIDVSRVYRGEIQPGITELGSRETTACTVSVVAGQTIIIATDSLSQLSPAGVWWVLDDGSLGTLAPDPPAATADELRATLSTLPDTSTEAGVEHEMGDRAPDKGRAFSPTWPAPAGALLLAASVFITAVTRRHLGGVVR